MEKTITIYNGRLKRFILNHIIIPRVTKVAAGFYAEFGHLKGLGQILHELIKRELIRICEEIGLTPLPEIVNPKDCNTELGRVDITFVDGEQNNTVFAFEIDQGRISNSISKLKTHGAATVRCIILFGEKPPKTEKLDKDLVCVDVTKEKLFGLKRPD